MIPSFDTESIEQIKRRAMLQAQAHQAGAENALQLLLQSGDTRQVQVPSNWRPGKPLRAPPAPPQLLETGTAINPGIVKENNARWQAQVNAEYAQKVQTNPPLAFAEGAGSVWPTWNREDTGNLPEPEKVAYYAGNVAGKIGMGFFGGAAVGRVLGGFGPATRVVGRVAGLAERHPPLAKALSGAMKGVLVGGEAAKGIKMKEQGYGWTDVVGSIAGDFAGLYGFEKGFSQTFIPRVSKELTIQKVHDEASRHRIYAGKTDNFLIGEEISVQGEKPMLIERGPRTKLMPDQTRATVGAVEMTYKGRPLGERPVLMKRFMTAGERATYGDRFPLLGVRQEEIFSGGLPAQVQIPKTISKMRYDSAFGAFRSAIKEASKASTIAAEVGTDLARAFGEAGYGVVELFKQQDNPFKASSIFSPNRQQEITPSQNIKQNSDFFQVVVPRDIIELKQKAWQEQKLKTGERSVQTPSLKEGLGLDIGELTLPQPAQEEAQKTPQKTRPALSFISLGIVTPRRGRTRMAPARPAWLPRRSRRRNKHGAIAIEEWSRVNKWGDIELSLRSLKQQLKELKKSLAPSEALGW